MHGLRILYPGLMLRLGTRGVDPRALVREDRAGVVLTVDGPHPQLAVLAAQGALRIVVVGVLVDLGASGCVLLQPLQQLFGVPDHCLQLGLDHEALPFPIRCVRPRPSWPRTCAGIPGTKARAVSP